MDEHEYAKRYRRGDTRSVKKYLDQERVCGAVCKDDKWIIPDGAKVRYQPRKRNHDTVEDNIADILIALHGNWYIDAECLCLNEADYTDRVSILKSSGLVTDSAAPCNGVTSCGLSLTPNGLKMASENKPSLLAMYRETIAGITEGTLRAISS